MSDLSRLTESLADRYTIDREVGAGGMATVYLARDLKHDRQVALKVLKPELGAILGVDWFLAEIKTTANLQHPNLLPLFDSGEANGLLFYVMPFVEGESLRARLDREKQLPVDEAVRIAVAIANALDYAHSHQVIHRDLKPENILLQHGQPVIADFGIALAVSKAGGARITQTGLSLGTPQYMSPEQAAGDRAVDGRSDIYSLAAMTYEMLAGDPPHLGSTAQAIIAKVLTERPPDVRLARPSVPEQVAATLARALEKLAADRFATAHEFADALEGRSFTPASRGGTTSGRAARAGARSYLFHPLVLAGVTTAALALAAFEWSAAHREAPAVTVRFPIALPRSVNVNGVVTGSDVVVSPDGRNIAFIATSAEGLSRLYLRPLDDVQARVVPGTDNASELFFAPDGRSLGFFANGKVYRVSIEGGSPLPIADMTAPFGIAWSSSGVIVASTGGGLVTVAASGGTPRVLTKVDSANGEVTQAWPIALPDGENVLFVSHADVGRSNGKIGVASLKTGKTTLLAVGGLFPLGIVDGFLVYVNNANALLAVPFDIGSRRVTGTPMTVATDIVTGGRGTAAKAALSPTGTLVFQSGSQAAQVVLVDTRGGLKPLLAEPRAYMYPRFSPDGKRVAMAIVSGARSDIWIYDVASATSTRLTTEGTINERPEWSPDGKRVVFRSLRSKRSSLWWQPADLSGPATPLLSNDRNDFFEGVLTPDGRALVYQVDNAFGANGSDVWYRMLAGDSTPKPIAATPFVEAQARVSPDGKWVAFMTTASGANQVVVQPFPGPGAQVQLSTAGGNEPVWAPDGKRLFYRDGQRLIAATFTTAPTFTVTSRTPLFEDVFAVAPSPHANYDVSADGSQFLMVKSTESNQLIVAHNWIAEVRARLAAKK